jgi:hypothetical protein
LTADDFKLLLECWSFGVLENRTYDKNLPIMKTEINRILFPRTSGALNHYSITPTLPGFFKVGPPVSDPAERISHFTLI